MGPEPYWWEVGNDLHLQNGMLLIDVDHEVQARKLLETGLLGSYPVVAERHTYNPISHQKSHY